MSGLDTGQYKTLTFCTKLVVDWTIVAKIIVFTLSNMSPNQSRCCSSFSRRMTKAVWALKHILHQIIRDLQQSCEELQPTEENVVVSSATPMCTASKNSSHQGYPYFLSFCIWIIRWVTLHTFPRTTHTSKLYYFKETYFM